MRKNLSGGERRNLVDKLLERYAADVWKAVLRRHDDALEAEEAFLQVFVVAILKLTRPEAVILSDGFIQSCIEQVESSSIPHRLLEGPIEDEVVPIEEFVRKTASDGDPSADGTSDGAIEGDDGAGGDPESDEAEQVQIPFLCCRGRFR